ncbi:MAG: hypothetical protein NTW30_05665, partial [Candidatus Aenigmarchaeota archaeon]|nr:hypothetical protein [Candidatus Aenigmarchaeota archaeon]
KYFFHHPPPLEPILELAPGVGEEAIENRLDKNPDELVRIKRVALEKELEYFFDTIPCKRTRIHKLFALKKFFYINGKKNLNFPRIRILPRREQRVRPEYVPTLEEAWKMADHAGSLRNRLIIMFFFITGLRNSTLRVLKYNDVPTQELWQKDYTIENELNQGKKNIVIIVDPGMKKYHPNACKNGIPYYVFTSEELTETLKSYLNSIKEKNK